MLDECPHRLAPLSQGRVDRTTNCIECPCHGWQFHANGTLVNIPQLEPEKTLPKNKNLHPCQVDDRTFASADSARFQERENQQTLRLILLFIPKIMDVYF
jgi:phenylpropionate dioxygenase-like ring-hydroxylating dioxygenase large terminal subunit